ncbi:YaiI/YqxD family protein [uncultured Vagococcus sp.]|uniref:YaiI/YqxD family protein n=1 Tax=uncultured Vagococcus sp. TaxID=189676 RepID=UPI0028D03107|nr:YaiI/YqxD family protein [uncultured Vagococcus sp.]
MEIYIDGDACPVKEEVYRDAQVAGLKVTLVTSLSHHSGKALPENVNVVYVDEGADSADYRIVALIKPGDMLITQDYGLASLVLPKGVRVMHHLGYEYTQENIGQMLESRYMGAQLRKSGQRTKGPKKYSGEDREKFQKNFNRIVSELSKNN